MDDSNEHSTTTDKRESPGTLLKEILAIILLSVVLGFTYNSFSSRGLPIIRTAPIKTAVGDSDLFTPVKPVVQPPAATDSILDTMTHRKIPVYAPNHKRALAHPDSVAKLHPKKSSGYSIVSIDQVKRLLDEHKGAFLDAREPQEFEEGHIAGARNVPFLSVDKYFEEVMSSVPQDTLVVVYCSGPDCPLGRGLADWLVALDYKHVVLYDDGFDGWSKAKMPFEGTKAKK